MKSRIDEVQPALARAEVTKALTPSMENDIPLSRRLQKW
jgi:hypothetical protein